MLIKADQSIEWKKVWRGILDQCHYFDLHWALGIEMREFPSSITQKFHFSFRFTLILLLFGNSQSIGKVTSGLSVQLWKLTYKI